jgi:glycosyltransferase involved in cell wall biosynthesis
MQKTKVVFIITHPIQYYVPLLQGLSKNEQFDVHVLYTWGEESISKFDPGFNKTIEWDIPLLDGYNYKFLRNIAKDAGSHHYHGIDNPDIITEIRKLNPDKIVVFGWSYKSHLKVLRKFHGKVPIYFRGDSHLLNEGQGLKKWLRRLFLRWVYNHVDYAISVGTQNKAYYNAMGMKESQILFAPHAIDESRFLMMNGAKSFKAWQSSIKIPDDHITFIYIGKFENRKNLETLIKAKRILNQEPCTLLLVGSGPDEQKLKKLAEGDHSIHFHGFVNQSDIVGIYQIADVYVLPSHSETWGLGVNEAMNAGLALILSDKVGCAIDLLKNNGLIFKSKDEFDLANKIMTLIKNKELLFKMKKESKDLISSWSIKKMISDFEQILICNDI